MSTGVDLDRIRSILSAEPGAPQRTGPALWRPGQPYQATGMVMSALKLSALDALDTLRARSFANGQLLTDLASDIVTGRDAADLGCR